jgi:hypothetical protein
MARLRQCRQAGHNNGIRTASAGSTLNRPLAAHSGILLRICHLAHMLHPPPAHPTCHQVVTMSAASSETPTVTKDTTTRHLELPQTRLRRRRVATLLPCSLPLVSVVSQLVPSLAINSVFLFSRYDNSITPNIFQPTTATMRTSSSHTLLLQRPPLLLRVATELTPVTELIPPMALLHHQILMRTTQPLQNLLQFQPMMKTVAPFQVATVSLWKRSARSSSRRRRRIKRNSRRTTRTNRDGFVCSIGWSAFKYIFTSVTAGISLH